MAYWLVFFFAVIEHKDTKVFEGKLGSYVKKLDKNLFVSNMRRKLRNFGLKILHCFL